MSNDNFVVGANIKRLREQMGLTQESLAQYLGTSREQVAYCEVGSRAVSAAHLAKLADLFCMDEYEFYEEDLEKIQINLAFAFRAENLTPDNLNTIAQFKRIVKNYLNMKKAIGNA
jgi:transcriptional regulator with XRE-family HTH domain